MSDRFKTFTVLINKISSSIRRLKMLEMEKLGLKSAHVSCLYYLYSYGGALTAKQLCDICEEDKAAISRTIEYLENSGYICCDTKSEKRYNSPLRLTEKGKEVGDFISKKIEKFLSEASRGINDDDRKALYANLGIISANLSKIVSKSEDEIHG